MLYDVLVIGAGQAGLAAGYYLQQAGLDFAILDGQSEPAGSWPHYYDSLVLNSPARYSALPGLALPGDPDRYPTRDEVVAYLRGYAAHFRLPIMARTRVVTVKRLDSVFQVHTDGGACYFARAVIAATGVFGRPFIPALPGRPQYQGQVLHMAAYRRSEPFRGQRIVSVGGGNGAVQIAVELAAVANVTLATRRPVRMLPQRLLGRDLHFWFTATGLDHTQWLGSRTTPVYANDVYRAALRAGRPDRRPLFTRLTEEGVIWSDGREERVDTVILATGYRPNLDYLDHLGVQDADGRVMQRGGISTTVPGLGFVGMARQRTVASATLRGVGPDAQVVIGHLSRYLQARQAQPGLVRGSHRNGPVFRLCESPAVLPTHHPYSPC